jgi:signal transduction histidine kinase
MIWYVQNSVSSALEDQLEERGVALGTGMAARSSDLILTNNRVALYNLAKDTLNSNQDLRYVFVLDDAGSVLVHTLEGGFPTDLLEVNVVNSEVEYQVTKLQTENGLMQDVAVPVLGGTAGVVRLGMSEAGISAAISSYVKDIIKWMAVISVVGVLVAYGLSRLLTKPVAQMVEGTQAMSLGNFKWKAPVWAKDEIGRLGAAFNKMCQELSAKEETRKQLLAKVMSSQEEERKRIARELHDGTSQTLTSLMVGLKVIEESRTLKEVKGKTAEMRELTASALDEVRDLALELRPSVLDDVGLVPALQRYIREYSAKTDINVDSHVSNLDGHRLLPEIETAIYRVVQEALTNIAKHAEARNASFVLEFRNSSLVAIVEDDGKGFDVGSAIRSGGKERKLGLFGMQERASLIGGTLTVESQPGVGTTIFLEVPLELTEARDEQDQDSTG